MATKKKPIKKKSVKDSAAKAKAAFEKEVIQKGNIIIQKFTKKKLPFDKSIVNLLPVYKTCMEKIAKVKSVQFKPLLWSVKRLSQINALSEALHKSASTGNPVYLWIAIVKNINWLNDKNK